MPILEERIERAVHDAAPVVGTAGVLERVAAKRARRRAVRRLEGAVAMVALVVALVAATTFVFREDDSAQIAAPSGGFPGVEARVITGGAITAGRGRARTPELVVLDRDEGYLRGPLAVVGSTLSLAAYDRDGIGYRFPPSRVVRVAMPSLHVEQRIDLKAEVLSIADGEGAHWVLTRNPVPANGLPDAFLKRIDTDGSPVSVLLPPPADPVGEIVVANGAVWVPVRDGVLAFDIATGKFTARVLLPAADSRSVVRFGQAVGATNGSTLQRVDGRDPLAVAPLAVAPPGETIVGGASARNEAWIVMRSSETGSASYLLYSDGVAALKVHGLPQGFTPTAVHAVDDRMWIEGTAAGAPAIVLVPATGNSTTVVLDGATDASFAWVDAHTVLAVSGGHLLRLSV